MTYSVTIKGSMDHQLRRIVEKDLGKKVLATSEDRDELMVRVLDEEAVLRLYRNLNGRFLGFDVYPSVPRLFLMQEK